MEIVEARALTVRASFPPSNRIVLPILKPALAVQAIFTSSTPGTTTSPPPLC